MVALMDIVVDASERTIDLSLILATLWIINNDLAKYTTSVLTIGQYAINQENRFYHNDLINEVTKLAMKTPNIKFYVECNLNQEQLHAEEVEEVEEHLGRKILSRDKFIWFLDSMTSYKHFERDLLNPKLRYHRSGVFILVYTGTEAERLNNIKKIFDSLFNLYCINVNVLLVVGSSPYLYTYFPFTRNKCHSSLPELYLSFRDIQKNFSSFEVNKPIFPSKVTNMHACELAVVTWQYEPYVLTDEDPSTGALVRLQGIEGSLITLLAKEMNFTIRLKVPQERERGDVYPNKTATGATKMIIDAQANITILSLLYNRRRSEVMQASSSYLYIPYVLAIPQGRKMSSFERLAKPFRYIIWLCFSFSIIFGIIFIYYVRFLGKSKLMDFIYGQGNRIPFPNLMSVLFGATVHGNLPIRNFSRFLLLIFLLYTFVLRSAYSGALYILLQDGRARHTYKSISEVVDNNFTIYAYPAVTDVLVLTIPEAKTANFDATNTADELFQRISTSKTEKIALCLLEYSVRLYNQEHPNRRVEVVDQTLLTAPIVFYMPLHTYLRYRIDELILRILQAGLMKRFESYYLYSSRQPLTKKKEPVQLSFHLLFAIFYIYAVWILFSLAIFLLEWATTKSACCRIIVDFLNV